MYWRGKKGSQSIHFKGFFFYSNYQSFSTLHKATDSVIQSYIKVQVIALEKHNKTN